MKLKSLQQRLSLAILLPVGALLLAVSFLGYFYARNIMLNQWREGAVLKLQRAAHHIDMRLEEPIRLINLLAETGGEPDTAPVQAWLLQELETLDGITGVFLKWNDVDMDRKPDEMPMHPMRRGMAHMSGTMQGMPHMGYFHRARIDKVTNPVYDAKTDGATVSLLTYFKDEAGATLGSLKVNVRFDYLMEGIQGLSWWQSDSACLVDKTGLLLVKTAAMRDIGNQLGESGNPLEQAVLARMESESRGTMLGPGHPPKTVAGFYKIENAPWFLVMFAPGERVLSPIVRFRNYFALAGALAIIAILLLIRFTVGRITESIREISGAADKIAGGRYGENLPVRTDDEIGQLTRHFNTMVEGLQERDFIRNTFGRYMDEEVAREIIKRPEAARLGGDKRAVAILMSDIRGFTPLAESLEPESTLTILNLYFGRMIDVIKRNRGIIVDFFGDGVLVFFDPLDKPLAPALMNAISCAVGMQKEMIVINKGLTKKGLPALETGIGINAGPVVVGNIGSETRAKYGIVGSAVNLTQRIQSEAGPGEIVLSEAVYAGAEKPLEISRTFEVALKGLHGEQRLHVLGGLAANAVADETPLRSEEA